MATTVLKNAYFSLDGTDLSGWVTQITAPELTQAMLDDSAMGDDAESYVGGLKGSRFSVTFNADFAASASEATIYSVWNGDAAVTYEIRPDAGTVSSTNPSYTGSVWLTRYAPVDGSVGDKGALRADFQGTGDVTRAVV